MPNSDGLYILLISAHGLTRGHDLELGCDADTGGQIKYVIELARALSSHQNVSRVDLLTRRIIDPKVDNDYAQEEEQIAPHAYIVRLPFGPRRYLRKEVLWPYLDSFSDAALQHIRRVHRVPDLIHAHYADAGIVGARLSSLLEVPLVFTGHSLGRVKNQRLLDQGMKAELIESEYRISQRIEAEEIALDNASFVIASTRQEVEEQYSLYDNYQPQRIAVIPPGVDLHRFHAPTRGWYRPPIFTQLSRFLSDTRKPIIMALSRADVRKNISTLVRAFGENAYLRKIANLVVVAGNRDDINAMEKGPRGVLTELLYLIDRYDLYGSIAFPKHHDPQDVPDLYRLVTKSRGVFVNPALTEPFGLTLVEAAASGAPVVATEDGGPQDIVHYCKNGVLVDPLNPDHMGEVLVEALSNRQQWMRWSKNGVKGAQRHFSWAGHVHKYMREIKKIVKKTTKRQITQPSKSRLPVSDRILICDIDNTLIGDTEALRNMLGRLNGNAQHIGFGVATGRRLESTVKALKEWSVPMPDLLITSVGAEIYYGPRLVQDQGWKRHIDYRWEPQALRKAMRRFPGLKLQPKEDQREFKISYFVDPDKAPSVRELKRSLRQADLHANIIYSHQAFIDLLPMRASKGLALRYLGDKWGLPPERFLVAGDSGNDEEMLSGNTLGVIVGNHSPELEKLRGREWIYFSKGHYAWGIIEGMEYYDFFGTMQVATNLGMDG